MKRAVLAFACVAIVLSGCEQQAANEDEQAAEALRSINVIDESNLNELMVNAGSPDEAILYFRQASAKIPGRIDLKRGLAGSLVRGGKNAEGASVWAEVIAMPGATNEDRVEYADALIRAGDWQRRRRSSTPSRPPTRPTAATGWRRWWRTQQELEQGRQLLRDRGRPDDDASRGLQQLGTQNCHAVISTKPNVCSAMR